ncbi:hypothetical protein [Endozoicomonas numazuensis]|uniref:Uncharacterized protein n=1 Tax=Endozoicomonas numazuensis TaxID=1137799 RepID=A0A081NLU7_9GAMM|nr:hypothetical protein [Endozoicomonas numazuensis]KEQ19420.1 hypothetical protein GZ78_05575 [Endozoicomonas numazuensis]
MSNTKKNNLSEDIHASGFPAFEQHLLYLKLAIQKFALSIGSSVRKSSSGNFGTWPEQLEQLRWRYKLRFIDFYPVKKSWVNETDLLPVWAQEALKSQQLYLIAYVPFQNVHSAVYLGADKSMAAGCLSSGIEADEAISTWCRRSGFTVTGVCLNSFLNEETLNRLASRSADTRYLLTDLPFVH